MTVNYEINQIEMTDNLVQKFKLQDQSIGECIL